MRISDFTRGWFIGNFEPSLLKSDFEVGLRWNDRDNKEDRHYHKRTTEYVVFAGGMHRLNDRLYSDGEMLVITPYISTDYECLEPGYCLTVKDISDPKDKYKGQPVNLVIPAAGKGQRFKDAGYETPKPLIDIHGESMISRVIKNFRPRTDHRVILIARSDAPHLSADTGVEIIDLAYDTEGAVSTVLEAEKYIGREDPLIIANCDQLILGFDVNDFMAKAADCSVAVFPSDVPHHSYVKEENGLVTEVAEKQVISNKAVGGVYFYRKSKYFFDNARRMIKKDIRVNGEFYTTPVFNEIIADRLNVNTYEVPLASQQILGTPAELQEFERKLKSREIHL